jgi:hypothetical protein
VDELFESMGFVSRTTPAGNLYWSKGFIAWSEMRGFMFCGCPVPHIKTREQIVAACNTLQAAQ